MTPSALLRAAPPPHITSHRRAGFGREGGYLARQIKRWDGQYKQASAASADGGGGGADANDAMAEVPSSSEARRGGVPYGSRRVVGHP